MEEDGILPTECRPGVGEQCDGYSVSRAEQAEVNGKLSVTESKVRDHRSWIVQT